MRILIDVNLPPSWADFLAAQDHYGRNGHRKLPRGYAGDHGFHTLGSTFETDERPRVECDPVHWPSSCIARRNSASSTGPASFRY
jgi:hypothetical protein